MASASKSAGDLRDQWRARDGTIGVPEWRAFLIDELCKRFTLQPAADDLEWLEDLLRKFRWSVMGPQGLYLNETSRDGLTHFLADI